MAMSIKPGMIAAFLVSVTFASLQAQARSPERVESPPNVVLIYADDLGFGDVSCYNPNSKIPTPNIDRLAAQGVRFLDAHSPDSICGPSRYGILTGRYSWRTGLRSGNPPPGSQPWINEGRIALPEMLRRKGYETAVFGKWGLGTDFASAAKPGRKGLDISAAAIDYAKPVFSGEPFGFTHEEVHLWYGREYFTRTYPSGLVPGAFEKTDGGRWYFVNGMSRGGNPDFAAFDMEEAQMHYIRRTVDWIEQAKEPFFVYYAPHIPHWPHVPAPQFQGTTEMGFYGDFIAQLDWAVGEIVQVLRKAGQLNNTLIVFTSDNGPEIQTYTYHEEGHASSGPWRGVKRDVWEGGHRTAFIVAWPGTVSGGRGSSRLISQTDIFATVADLLDVELEADCAEDSFSFLDELLPQEEVEHIRTLAIHHTGMSDTLALRKGDWVLINGPTGDNGRQEPEWIRQERGVEPHTQPVELFNLKTDPQQTKNLAAEHPERVKELKKLLNQLEASGRTRPE
jgi:arylsulfatase A-like enzyme